MTSSLHAIAELLAVGVVDSLAQGTVICLLAALILRLAPRQNAATRFAVWFLALAAIAASPWMGWLLPHAPRKVASTQHVAINLPDSWAFYFLALWGTAVIGFGFRLARALWHLHALRRDCVPVNTCELNPLLQETLQRHGTRRQIILCRSEHVRVPTAVGLFKPMILVPAWVMRELSPCELNQVLVHEFAHFHRWDDWTNLAQHIVKTIFFFHPAVWWIDRQAAIEREVACDDAVLAETRTPRAYAECLAHLAERCFVQRSIALAQAALGKLRQTSTRIAEILDVNRPASNGRSRGIVVFLLAVLAVACGALYSITPRLVAFGNDGDVQMEIASASQHHTPEPASMGRLPITQAKLNVQALPAKLNGTAIPARSNQESTVRRAPSAARVQVQQAKARNIDENAVHQTGLTSSTPPVTQLIWFMVESEGTDPAALQIYQIQMWRVTVIRTVITAPSRQVTRSET